MKILVVGGGTAGLVAATLLQSKLDAQVDLVFSKEIGTVGVGEGSTEHFNEFVETLGLDPYVLLRETNATLKSGIVFSGWNPQRPFMHAVMHEFAIKNGQYHYLYGRQIANNDHYLNSQLNWDSVLNKWFLNRREELPTNQYHFNTNMMGEFLTKVAEEIGCKVFDDEITDVVIKENGYVQKVRGNKRDYVYDFYVDATGFARTLIGPLGAKWNSFSEHMRMNSAITFQTENDDENFPLWTLAQAMDSGWMFRLPTWDHTGNGYIYDKEFVDEDGAKAEVEKLLGREVTIGKRFSFDPGHLDRPWINNVCAVGLASAFVEPLEATSIGTSIQQSFLLAARLMNYDDKSVESYNRSFVAIMENIRDYICLHYVTPRRDTEFWKAIADMPLPERLNERLAHWKHHLPISEDFLVDSSGSDFHLFGDANYILLMEGLELFDRRSIKKEYMAQSKLIRDAADDALARHKQFISSIPVVSHKGYVAMTRDVFS